ncbi:hypothetical protein OAW32_02560 [bacterium]|jgi:hypothetical protein|nr:hypothetical protein [bacterium]
MAHYAVLDENNIVTQVFVGKEEGEMDWDWELYYGAKRTSYNTHGGVHSEDGTPFRKNYAGIGYTYDEERDAFIPPQPYPSWTLNDDTCLWDCPVEEPAPIENEDGTITFHIWDEDNQDWLAFE